MAYIIRNGNKYFSQGGPKGRGSFWVYRQAEAWIFRTMEVAEGTLRNINKDIGGGAEIITITTPEGKK